MGKQIVLASSDDNPDATEGDDTISGIIDGGFDAKGGNDLFQPDNGYGAGMFGGDGNDTFAAAYEAAKIYGGRGDDRFEFGADTYESIDAFGGNGKDIFELGFNADEFNARTFLTGGNGADTYNLTFRADRNDDLALQDDERAAGLAPSGEEPSRMSTSVAAATITDFEPGSDTLVVDAVDFDDAKLVEDDNGTTLVMSYGAQKSFLTLQGAFGLKLEVEDDGKLRILA